MSRFYIISVFIFSVGHVFSQNELSNYLKFADEQYKKGDFYYALEYYEKAIVLDSNSLTPLWNYAETLKAYKDYKKAEVYYKKVYAKEDTQIYPSSLLNLGIMQKHNGKYEQAIETFKKCKKKYVKDKKSYLYLKAAREVESCLWAKSAIKDTSAILFSNVSSKINTKDSEFGHTIKDGNFIFSSLRADSIPSNEEVYATSYTTKLYSSKKKGKDFEDAKRIEDLYFQSLNTGNGTFSLDGKRFYFSLCKQNGYIYTCKIMVAKYTDGTYTGIDSLGTIINEPGANTTMPCIAEIDGQETLFFSSDRKGTEGGMDLWYSTIKNGTQFSKVKSIKSSNSLDNEISPWWDTVHKRLYFSSSWHDGFGGNDVFYTPYTTQFENPINAGIPINSSANDIYYFQNGDTSYVTSNRLGILFSKNPTCCSDIFTGIPIPVEKIALQTTKETLAELNKRLPVTLYFHNDVPDPRSVDTITKVNYTTSYQSYRSLLDTYKKEYATGLTGDKSEEAKEDIESFFLEFVDQGVKDLDQFRGLLLEELEKGTKLKITIKGFASPLAKTDYNVNLTKRRISSLINYLNEYQNGIFRPYMKGTAKNGGEVKFEEVPFGETTSNKLTSDNPNDQKNSIYSRAAAIERKIEIRSVSYLNPQQVEKKQEENEFSLTTKNQLIDAGKIKEGEVIERTFTITNTNNTTIELEEPTVPCDCNKVEIAKKTLQPGESTNIKISFDSKNYSGIVIKSIYLRVKDQKGALRLVLTSEISPKK